MIIRSVRLLFFAFLFFIAGSVSAQHSNGEEENTSATNTTTAHIEKFNAGKMIMDHIIDSYEWHILTYGEKHLSIPLPILILHERKLVSFMSSAFQHGHSPVFFDQNFDRILPENLNSTENIAFGLAIMHEGKHKSKIAYITADDYLLHHTIIENTEAGMPYDFSITKNVVSLWVGLLIILWLFFGIARTYKKRQGMAPKGIQSALEPFIVFIRDDIAKSSIGEHKHEKYLPFLLTIFFFIFINNIVGLVPFFPGGANLTGNIAVTMVLALFTFFITLINSNKNYWKHIFNTPGVPWWLKFPLPLMPIVEVLGVFTKPFVLMVRLFANITAGHIVTLGFISLIFIFGNINVGLGYGVSVISVAFAIFLAFLELLVALIQAYVFTLLSALYFGMATEEHHE
ncbi:MAG TPA: ATP synthase F0 subunit A [Bacteroidales bacterium]|nr:ATP synthase F0 subunit A [Bacteroidales bacterium]